MFKTFKYRLYPTRDQARTLEAHLAICCELYNAALQERRDAWRISRIRIQLEGQSAQLPALRRERPDVGAVYSQVLQNILRRADQTFQAFFRRVKRGERPGYPRFCPTRRFDSMTYPQYPNQGFAISSGALVIGKIGRVKARLHRPVEGTIKALTIKREAGQWYALITSAVAPQPLPASSEHVGLDMGLTHLATLSDGSRIQNHRYGKMAEAKVRRYIRMVQRRKIGSARRRQAVTHLQRAHAKSRRRRADAQHKASRALVSQYGLIVCEDLNVKWLAAGRLSKSVTDAAWSLFLDKVSYKAAHAGRTVIKVNPRGTSQTCLCGASVRKTLSERWHNCAACGLSADRDHVSAQVILSRGLRDQDVTWATAPSVF